MWAVLWQYQDKSAFGVWCVCETVTEARAIAGALNTVASDKSFWVKPVMEVSARGNIDPAGGGDAS